MNHTTKYGHKDQYLLKLIPVGYMKCIPVDTHCGLPVTSCGYILWVYPVGTNIDIPWEYPVDHLSNPVGISCGLPMLSQSLFMEVVSKASQLPPGMLETPSVGKT